MLAPNKHSEASQHVLGDRYRLRNQLGSGAMGVAWAAYDKLLRRPVAVKEIRLPVGMPQDEADNLRERTLRETRAIAALSHPNVITVYDVVQQTGAPFVVMELMSGSSLAALLRDRGRLAVRQAAAVAAGLQSRAPDGHYPSRSQAGQRARRRGRPDQADQLRHRAQTSRTRR